MKTDRLMGILAILSRQKKTTAPALAERFEVSRRTILRDLDALCRAGIPIVTVQGYDGGISLAEGYRLDGALLSERETEALLTGLKGLCSVLDIADFGGLLEWLSGQGRRAAGDEIIQIDLASFYQEPLAQKLGLFRQAIRQRRLVSFCYYYSKGESQRTIEPYRLVFQWSSWYVLGYCLDRQAFRLFHLNRLWTPETGGGFVPREIPSQELSYQHYFEQEGFRLRAVFEPSEKYRLIEAYGPDCYMAAADGRLLFERGFAGYENMREWVLSFGSRVEVLAPGQLRDDLRRQAEALLRMYG